MKERLPDDWEVDIEDLGNVFARARIQSCNACVSTSMALCVWPCNCYEKIIQKSLISCGTLICIRGSINQMPGQLLVRLTDLEIEAQSVDAPIGRSSRLALNDSLLALHDNL